MTLPIRVWWLIILATSLSVTSPSALAVARLQRQPVPLAADFIKGADLSMLAEVEKHGGQFFNAHGHRQDAMLILKDNGFNYIRLRVWVDPTDADGNPYGGGNNDLATTIALAKRAKAHGMKLLLDYHYSDFWTDPGRQNKPKAWASMDHDQLIEAVYQYTDRTMAALAHAGVVPDMVQVGNEINGGMLWPEGKSWGQHGGEFDRLAALLKAGIKAVKGHGEQIKIMLHLAQGTKSDTFIWWFDEITKRQVPFDVIGLSYYIYWDGPLQALQHNMDTISRRYDKDLIVVETAYGYTLANCDSAENTFTANEAKDAGYPATVQGQANYLHDLLQSISQVPAERGKGLFYWEPAWLPTPGATWATRAGMHYNHDVWKEGNARENQSLFDCQGKVLPSIKVFKPPRAP